MILSIRTRNTRFLKRLFEIYTASSFSKRTKSGPVDIEMQMSLSAGQNTHLLMHYRFLKNERSDKLAQVAKTKCTSLNSPPYCIISWCTFTHFLMATEERQD